MKHNRTVSDLTHWGEQCFDMPVKPYIEMETIEKGDLECFNDPYELWKETLCSDIIL